MSFSNSTETSINSYVFGGVAVPWDGNTNLWLALFTADPTETGSLAAEATYGGYARVAVNRTTGLTITGATVSNTNLAQFPVCTSGSSTCTYVAIVDTASGAVNMMVSGALNSSVAVTTGIQPQFSAAALVFQLD